MRMRLLSALTCGTLGWSSAAVAGTIPGDLALTPAVTGVGQPIAIRNAGDDSGRLFVVNRAGLIYVVPEGQSTRLATPFLDIAPLIGQLVGEVGLLGLAFDPDYANNRRFYVSYNDTARDSVIARYTASVGSPNVADPASATILLRVDQGDDFHKGGDIHFGLDGYLYIALGDGAEGSNDNCNRAQSLTPQDVIDNNSDPLCTPDAGFAGNVNSRALMGKILRIDVNGTTPAGSNELCASAANGSAPYAIPAANPFAGANGGAGRCDEIFAYGLRNPFRFSVDRATGDLFIGDVGESSMEEVDFVPAASPGGINFGWPRCEGTVPGPVSGATCSGFTAPILTYAHGANGGGCSSLTGGFRYRGAITGLQGTYVFSDYCSGRIRFGEQSGGSWTWTQWLDGPNIQHTSFGEDEDGELYLAEVNSDRILRFTSAQVGPVVDIFENGFEN